MIPWLANYSKLCQKNHLHKDTLPSELSGQMTTGLKALGGVSGLASIGGSMLAKQDFHFSILLNKSKVGHTTTEIVIKTGRVIIN